MPDCFLSAKLCPPKNLRGGILELGHGNDVVSVHSPDRVEAQMEPWEVEPLEESTSETRR